VSTEADDILDLGDLDLSDGNSSEFEVIEHLDQLSKAAEDADDAPDLAKERGQLVNQLERASALAKKIDDPIVTWLIQSTLMRLRE
jgi:hypothetical protein